MIPVWATGFQKDSMHYSFQGLQVWCPPGFEAGRIKLKSGTEQLLIRYKVKPGFGITISKPAIDSTNVEEVQRKVDSVPFLVKQTYHLKYLPELKIVTFGHRKYLRTAIEREKWTLLTGYVVLHKRVYFAEVHFPKDKEPNCKAIRVLLETIIENTDFDNPSQVPKVLSSSSSAKSKPRL